MGSFLDPEKTCVRKHIAAGASEFPETLTGKGRHQRCENVTERASPFRRGQVAHEAEAAEAHVRVAEADALEPQGVPGERHKRLFRAVAASVCVVVQRGLLMEGGRGAGQGITGGREGAHRTQYLALFLPAVGGGEGGTGPSEV